MGEIISLNSHAVVAIPVITEDLTYDDLSENIWAVGKTNRMGDDFFHVNTNEILDFVKTHYVNKENGEMFALWKVFVKTKIRFGQTLSDRGISTDELPEKNFYILPMEIDNNSSVTIDDLISNYPDKI